MQVFHVFVFAFSCSFKIVLIGKNTGWFAIHWKNGGREKLHFKPLLNEEIHVNQNEYFPQQNEFYSIRPFDSIVYHSESFGIQTIFLNPLNSNCTLFQLGYKENFPILLKTCGSLKILVDLYTQLHQWKFLKFPFQYSGAASRNSY